MSDKKTQVIRIIELGGWVTVTEVLEIGPRVETARRMARPLSSVKYREFRRPAGSISPATRSSAGFAMLTGCIDMLTGCIVLDSQ